MVFTEYSLVHSFVYSFIPSPNRAFLGTSLVLALGVGSLCWGFSQEEQSLSVNGTELSSPSVHLFQALGCSVVAYVQGRQVQTFLWLSSAPGGYVIFSNDNHCRFFCFPPK